MRATEGPGVRFFRLECPYCQTSGRIPIDRLHKSFKCKRCGRTFHVEPNEVALGARQAAPRDFVDDGLRKPRWLLAEQSSRAWQAWMSLPRSARYAAGGAVAIGAAFVAAWLAFREPGPALPESLEGRAAAVARATIENDPQVLESLAAPDSREAAVEWLQKARETIWGRQPAGTGHAESTIAVKYQRSADKKTGVAEAGVSIAFVKRGANAGERPQKFECVVYWTKQADQDWKIDGFRTLRDGIPAMDDN